ncbi:MAG: threonine synthase [Candidatus Aminicenantes bacterium]|nr:threonine synthase [Candidatus Aminicenantes bacterium]NIM80206.1 threonine synthase [Candidatus Aminicenantes bacterium]NIN19545.1 threonine synthase [Candidatus Aminicenantes bacterium]NIN43439.1 threonine synthase [Candidatus Aminicenantes bacterium]NIN86184.1 threonine synthase [Candidatus Aminicenantes bacterium]
MNFLTHLECGMCSETLEPDKIWNLCPKCSKPLLVRYDLEAAKKAVNPDAISGRSPNMWRYQELLPVIDKKNILTLGEGFTPLHLAKRLGSELGFGNLYIKDEGLNPTGSFKARGLCMAISRAMELGITSVSIPTAGNAGGAMSAYAALAGMEAFVFMPKDVPKPFINECKALGASVTLIDGLITDCGKAARKEVEKYGRFDVSTLKEPYRIEGKKTMGYELAEQMNWRLPDVIIYPTGGGTGLVGMWKAFDEMEKLGWIDCKRPRMVTVQSDGCAPMVKAFHEGKEFADMWQGAKTIADGLRVPAAVGDFLILRALRESNGTAVAVPDEEIMESTNLLGQTQGIFAAPEGGATLAGFIQLRKQGWIKDDETVVLFNTGSGHKYSHLWD